MAGNCSTSQWCEGGDQDATMLELRDLTKSLSVTLQNEDGQDSSLTRGPGWSRGHSVDAGQCGTGGSTRGPGGPRGELLVPQGESVSRHLLQVQDTPHT